VGRPGAWTAQRHAAGPATLSRTPYFLAGLQAIESANCDELVDPSL
jgi:hypothetical protein